MKRKEEKEIYRKKNSKKLMEKEADKVREGKRNVEKE